MKSQNTVKIEKKAVTLRTDFPNEGEAQDYYNQIITSYRENTPYRQRKEKRKKRKDFFESFVSFDLVISGS